MEFHSVKLTKCDRCGATSNSAPNLPCDWRADGLPDEDVEDIPGSDKDPRCSGTYRAFELIRRTP